MYYGNFINHIHLVIYLFIFELFIINFFNTLFITYWLYLLLCLNSLVTHVKAIGMWQFTTNIIFWDLRRINDLLTLVQQKRSGSSICNQRKRKINKVKCRDEPLKNTCLFKHLGSMFVIDGNQQHDVKRRITLITSCMGQLRHVSTQW